MLSCFDCEALQPFDLACLSEDSVNYCNILGVLFFEPFEYESMRNFLIMKTENLHKCRSKLTKKLGSFWFQKMSRQEWETKKDDVFVRKEGVHTDEDLKRLMCDEHSIRDPYDTV